MSNPVIPSSVQWLTALPVYNEAKYVAGVLEQVFRHSPEVLVVNDGSTDGTSAEFEKFPQLHVVEHPQNRGYGAALRTAFDFALEHGYDYLVTIDCDGQHQPQQLPLFIQTALETQAEIVSGSRYLGHFDVDNPAPEDRRRINRLLTAEINRRLGFQITDAFCGFKAYRVPPLAQLELTETGYAMPLELWVQAASLGFKVVELPVPRIYLDATRSFGGALDDAATRLEVYHLTLDRSIAQRQCSAHPLPFEIGLPVGCGQCPPCGDAS